MNDSNEKLYDSLLEAGLEVSKGKFCYSFQCPSETLFLRLKELKEKWGFLYLRDAFFFKDSSGKRFFVLLLENFQEKMALKVISPYFKKGEGELQKLWQGSFSLIQDHDYFEGRDETVAKLPKHELPVVRDYCVERMNWRRFQPWSKEHPYGFELFLEFLDEKVVDLKVEKGFCFRGVESQLEGQHFIKGAPFIERLNYQSPIFGEILWNEALEKQLDCEVSDRVKALRMVFLELSRVFEHFQTFSRIFNQQGFHIEMLRSRKICQLIQDLLSKVSHKKVFHELSCLGGLRKDIPKGWKQDCHRTIHEIEKAYLSFREYFYRNELWLSRLSVGAIDPYQAIEYCLSGPNLRSCGLHYDLRKYRSSLLYSDVDFEVPLGINGDSYNRFIVRNEEVFQSLSIISQVIDNLPIGEIQTFNLEVLHEQKVPDGWIHHQIESPTGALGVNILLKDQHLEHLSLRCPSVSTLSSLKEIVGQGLDVMDVFSTISTLNIVETEVDR